MVVLSTRCLILNELNEVLLVEINKHDCFDSLTLPGAAVKVNDETLYDSLIRGVKETTKIELKNPSYFKFLEHFSKDIFRRDIVFIYSCKCFKKDIDSVVSKTRRVKNHIWVNKFNLNTLQNVHPLLSKIVKEYLDTI